MSRAAADNAVTAVLGPTNTGKTHLALERMMARASGVMGLPLRLLARELYDRVVKVKGPALTALITGEEKIVPPTARYFLCTVEAMPLDMRPAFLGVDEIQLAADPERGHIFTDRLLHARGTQETMFMGAASMEGLIRRLVPDAEITQRERFSTLSYSGAKKLTKLPRRSAVVAFSADDVYAMAELVRRQRGGAAVVMGALSPRTRNAQVELYQSGEADFLIATDAIGMGLNMDVDHVAFASFSKFDGRKRRRLFPHEIGQIAGRAGRFRTDGTFGETSDARPLDAETIERVEDHRFDPITRLTWRNADLDLSSLDALRASLAMPSPNPMLERVRYAVDEEVLDLAAKDPEVRDKLTSRAGLARFWDVCRTPDFRKVSLDEHTRLVKTLFGHLTSGDGYLPDSWLEAQLARLSKTTGEVDTLSQRLTHVRTWAYASHRSDWTRDPAYWQERTREVEDRLSDALHEQLTARFIDRRTSALMKGLREKTDLEAGIDGQGDVVVEGHHVGRLSGLRFEAVREGGPLARRAVANAALKAVRPEVNRRLGAITKADNDALSLHDDGSIHWKEGVIARLSGTDDAFTPTATLVGGEMGSAEAIARTERRIERFVAEQAAEALKPLLSLKAKLNGDSKLTGLARGVAYQLVESFGAAPRRVLAADLANLSTQERRQLRQAGVQIGEHAVFMPALLKPKAARMNALLRAIKAGDATRALAPPAGRTSMDVEEGRPESDYAAAGYQRCGPLAVRLDMLERLADLIRENRAVHGKGRFEPGASMCSLLGCSNDELRDVLKALGYRRLQKASAPEGKDAVPELWGGRSRALKPEAKPAPVTPPKPDSPFAVLAELKSQPERRAKAERARPKRRRKPKSKPNPKAASS